MKGAPPQQCFIAWDGGLKNFLPGLASNYDLPDLCLLNSWNYRHEPQQLHCF
jgi:hypothetical protein